MAYTFDRAEYDQRMQWFKSARFGMFIHWGLYAIPARGEWVRSDEQMPEEQYLPFFDEFDPRDYDPAAWARAARKAGMKYAVLTAKHHDGFCLFDSKLTDFKATNTKAGRDLVREFLEAFRAEGLKVGLYYSLLDWHHPDYPHYGDHIHPMRNDPSQSNEDRDFGRYLDYMHGQVRELCENYGRIDLLWLDYSYRDMVGEKWRATELTNMVRTLQPGIIINDRLEYNGRNQGSLISGHPVAYHGDFCTPEQVIPPQGMRDVDGLPVAWESCVTMNNNWGYCRTDHYFKTPSMMVRKLVECVSKGGNMILNVGPDARGRFPDESRRILEGIGQWMERNGESIYGCGPCDDPTIPKPDYGRITRKGNVLYLHVMDAPLGPLPVLGIPSERIRSVRMLSDDSEIRIQESNLLLDRFPNVTFLDLGPDPQLPDSTDTVVRLELND